MTTLDSAKFPTSCLAKTMQLRTQTLWGCGWFAKLPKASSSSVSASAPFDWWAPRADSSTPRSLSSLAAILVDSSRAARRRRRLRWKFGSSAASAATGVSSGASSTAWKYSNCPYRSTASSKGPASMSFSVSMPATLMSDHSAPYVARLSRCSGVKKRCLFHEVVVSWRSQCDCRSRPKLSLPRRTASAAASNESSSFTCSASRRLSPDAAALVVVP
mmetsp:Transcript_14705/g.47969  ORF Transcript_14705/g.47969 Transcript_14705/m.47969 type:complete len:217 (-) Transcript_14705:965-1615(-)